ncbi:Origin of replication complex subunit 6 [Forsythia ovata]|uniref:Origin of replication complex subunit 6 n=1 Tax=Forsythia ovata TaxID=205694 RepID=A0ABD1XCY4_9LAMI
MDMSEIAKKFGLSESKQLIRKASELRRLADIQFNSSIIGVTAIKLSGMSEKAYSRSFNSMQNGIGVKYKGRFLTSLPSSRRASTDFTRPVFTAVAFYLCAKRHKLKADKIKLIELAGSSESEFSTVSTSMKDLCFDVFGTTKEKKDPKEVKGNRELLNALPEKRRFEDGGCSSDDGEEPSAYKKRKQMDTRAYDEWKSAVLQSNNTGKAKAPAKRSRQSGLNFVKKVPETSVEAT